MSDLFHGRLNLASTDPDVAAADVLEQPVDLVVWQDGQPLRRFTGVVNEFVRGDTGHRRTRYEVVIQPPLWRLGLMHNSRIFQAQTTDAIVCTLLEERGIVDSIFDFKNPAYALMYEHSAAGSTLFPRTVLKRLTTSDPERQLYVASWDYGTVRCNRIRQLALRSECGNAGGEFAPA